MKRNSSGRAAPEGNDAGLFKTEAADTSDVTTVKEYKYVPADKLPAVKGVSQYRWDPKEKILRFSYNVWAGWLPVIAANHGTKPNADSIFYKKYGFKVEMVLMDWSRTRGPLHESCSRLTGPAEATALSSGARSSPCATCGIRT
jgi:hypothetical protein